MEKNELQREEVKPEENASPLAVVITELGFVLSTKYGSAQATDPLGPRDRIALKASNDGYIEFADTF